MPTIWNDLVRYLDEHRPDVSSVKRLMVGGSACPPALMRAFQDNHDIEVVHGWGMTEMSPVGTLAIPPVAAEVGSDEYWRYRAAQGRLLPGVEARLIGPDGEVQPWDGESVGELEVRGPWITASYYANGSESEAELAEMRPSSTRPPSGAASSAPPIPSTTSGARSGTARSTGGRR